MSDDEEMILVSTRTVFTNSYTGRRWRRCRRWWRWCRRRSFWWRRRWRWWCKEWWIRSWYFEYILHCKGFNRRRHRRSVRIVRNNFGYGRGERSMGFQITKTNGQSAIQDWKVLWNVKTIQTTTRVHVYRDKKRKRDCYQQSFEHGFIQHRSKITCQRIYRDSRSTKEG